MRCDKDCFNCKYDDCLYEDESIRVYSTITGQCKGFGERLRKVIKDNNLKQAELAYKVGITPATISQYIHGRTIPRGDHIVVICRELKISSDWLLGLEEKC